MVCFSASLTYSFEEGIIILYIVYDGYNSCYKYSGKICKEKQGTNTKVVPCFFSTNDGSILI